MFENLLACLRAGGCEPADVIKVNAYLADLGDFAAFNEVYRANFQEPYPARTTVGVSLPGGILVEVEAIARRPALSSAHSCMALAATVDARRPSGPVEI